MSSTNSEHWSNGLLPVIYEINTCVACVTNYTPYEVMFEQKLLTTNILTAVQKKRKLYDEHLTLKAEQYKVGGRVGIQISEVDRTHIDVKLLLCFTLSKDKKK
ncbi:unnamed protein product [Didymodactylos carnosus]|uniref:Uncharacterized protein n=1 Tax=Didymodactylos carnosus TaxID=1234261 RepID=A0A8S2J9L3_9BILA|nr:unnamed protein product [Didymodactylos carnosus]CAF3797769.1 unnamed protein product [Didymodactylos carnosus]